MIHNLNVSIVFHIQCFHINVNGIKLQQVHVLLIKIIVPFFVRFN